MEHDGTLWKALQDEVEGFRQPIKAAVDRGTHQVNTAINQLNSCLWPTQLDGGEPGEAGAQPPETNAEAAMAYQLLEGYQCEAALAKFDAAIALVRSRAVNPTRADLHHGRGTALIGLDRVEEAATECVVAITLRPTWEPPRERLAAICVHPRGFEAAFKAAREEQAKRPNAAAATLVEQLQVIAFAHQSANHEFSKDRFKEADIALSRGIETSDVLNPAGLRPAPGAAVLYCNRAAVRVKLQNYRGARADAEMAIRCVPGFVKAERLRQEADSMIKKIKPAEEAAPPQSQQQAAAAAIASAAVGVITRGDRTGIS